MKAVIITGNKYPLEDAGAIRQHAFAKILYALGYDVLVLGYGKPTNGRIEEFDGIRYVSFRPSSNNLGVRAFYRYFFIDRVVRYIKKNISEINVLLVVDVLPKDFKVIKEIANRYHSIIVHDSVEWYSPEEFEDGEKNKSYRNKEYTNNIAVGKGWRVIAISRLLAEHFGKKCDAVVRIPVIMDIQSIIPKLEIDNSKTVFVYAGGPGRKDYLDTIVRGFSLLSDEERNRIEFHVYGVNKEQLIKHCGVSKEHIDTLSDTLIIHGRVSHNEAVQAVMNASFTVLIRDETLRYAKAGFPTKIVESLAYGTPVLCNYSSDLKDYLVNEENAIIAAGHDPIDVKEAIIESINISNTKYIKMRENARNTAASFFDYRNYIEETEKLLK